MEKCEKKFLPRKIELLLALCIHKITQIVTGYFKDEVIKVTNIYGNELINASERRVSNHA